MSYKDTGYNGRAIMAAFIEAFVTTVFLITAVTQFDIASTLKINVIDEQTLWKAGDNGVNTYRIPIIHEAPDGVTLLAFCEARKESSSDSGSKYIALRRSKDHGKTWESSQFIYDDGDVKDGSNLGNVIVDKQTKTVFVIFTFCPHSCSISETRMIQSVDSGITWSKPINLSSQIGNFVFAPGPGYGIQKQHDPKVGRLISCGHGSIEYDGVVCIISDDHGETWKKAGTLYGIPYGQEKLTGDFIPDEPQVVELRDGSLLITARNQGHYHSRARFMIKSCDAADSLQLQNVYIDETLLDSAVQASMLVLNRLLLSEESYLIFSNPANTEERVNMTVRWSKDSGASWDGSYQVYNGPSAYSCLSRIPDNDSHFGLAYEKGTASAYQSISLCRLSII